MNGLCPACRRPYNDKDIVYKTATAEESQAYKQRQQAKQKKSQAAAQKEKLKAEADHLNRKHLAGLRVVQKNLVYVTGLSPTSQEDQLLQTLRGDQYFGQYGKILKIVVSKAKDPSHPNSVGVYVTYERKEDAATCIAAVNGSKNGDRILRAQFGTTKYCSAFLRGEQCQNRGCMFLHEAGEASESYSRADLSALNAGSTQHEGGRPPPPQSQQPIASASASQPMARQPSGDQPHSPFADRPALPSTASWAAKAPQQPSRNESRSTSGAHESPASSHATPATTQAEPAVQPKPPPLEPTLAEGLLQNTVKQHQQQQQLLPPPPQQQQQPPQQPQQQQQPSLNQSTPLYRTKTVSPLMELLKNFSLDDFRFVFSFNSFSDADLEIVKVYPPLFEKNGGAKRRLRRQREEEQLRIEQEETQQLAQPPSVPAEQPPEDNPGISGSLQLGGEPEERGGQTLGGAIGRPPNQDPSGILDQRFQFGGVASPAGLSDRGLTPQQQHQQMLLNNLGQAGMQQPTHPPGHQRNVSRYSFANETSSASTSIKPVANPGLMKQQSSIMPQQSGFGNQQQQYFGSNVQGPPPGLKTTGTPPVSGGMTFGQGHGFATGGLQYGAGASGRNANEEMMRNLLRGRDAAAAAAAAGSLLGATTTMEQKREFMSPPNHYPSTIFPPGSRPSAAAMAAAAGYGGPAAASGSSVFSSDGEKAGPQQQQQQRGKKKSKKHGRHGGNASSTSSNVDLNDPHSHLLQTRFQSAAGGLGVPGGVAQGGLYHPNGMMHGSSGGAAYGGRW